MSSGSRLLFEPVPEPEEYSTVNTEGVYLKFPPHIMILELHASFPINEELSFRDDKLKLSCTQEARRDRGRRDTTQQYVEDEIQPILDNLTIFSTMMELLYQTLLSQPLTDMSQFVQAVIGRTDIVGLVNKNVILYWPCIKIEFLFLPWMNDTLYLPVLVQNQTYFLNPYTQILYTSSPIVSRGLYVLIQVDQKAYLGATGSGTAPKEVNVYGHYVNIPADFITLNTLEQ